MNSTQFSGVLTALVTPMNEGSVNYEDLSNLVETQIEEGIDGIVAVGTTGESPALSHDEHSEVIRFCIEKARGRVPVVAGTGSNSTIEAVSLTRQAHDAGADALLQVAPYYNKPSQEGLFRHFSAVAESTDKPIILYSIPSRCGIEIGVGTVARLRQKHPHINVIKEAGGSCDRVSELVEAMGDDLTVLSGDDSLTVPFMAVGAKGVISVASNLVVKDLARMTRAALDNDFATATEIHLKYYPLFRALFIEPNPVPIKTALHHAGRIRSAEVRMPLCEMSAETRNRLFQAMTATGMAPS